MSEGVMSRDWSAALKLIQPRGGTSIPKVSEELAELLSAAVAVVSTDRVLGQYGCPDQADAALIAAAGGNGHVVSFGSEEMFNLARGTLPVTNAQLLVGRVHDAFTDDEYKAIDNFAHVLDLGLATNTRRSGGVVTNSLDDVLGASDTLTGLLTRDSFRSYLDAAIPSHEDADSVLVIGLDGFKIANDTLGYATGDVVLQTIASRILTCVREGDVAARIGGDVFAVYSPGIGSDLAADVARRLQNAISQRIPVGESDLIISASVGVATSWDNEQADTLIANADTAMRSAKAQGQGLVDFYDEELRLSVQARRTTASELQTAIAENQLTTVLEPIAATDDLTVVGHEARVRWQHPTRGSIEADEFMTLAADIGRVADVERAVFTFALQEHFRDSELPPISVNLSASSLLDENHIGWMLEQLELLGVDPARVMVEINERAVTSSPGVARNHLNRLREAGIGVVLDNFGQSITSIRSFHDFPFDGVKVHPSLFYGTTEIQSLAMMKSVYSSADVLGFDVIHVGVHTEEQFDQLVASANVVGRDVFFAQGSTVRDRVTAVQD